MSKYSTSKTLDKHLLFRLRNHIPVSPLISNLLKLPSKLSEDQFRFLCPVCYEFNTAVNTNTNLARCFRCRNNFNPIDLVMIVNRSSFLDAVAFLRPILDNARDPPPSKTHRSDQPERIADVIDVRRLFLDENLSP